MITVLFLSWYFLFTDTLRGHKAEVGPFYTYEQCEYVRKEMARQQPPHKQYKECEEKKGI